MSKASLRFLCEVLLSDTCTKNVTDNINAAISRLSIVRANRNVLTELIAEVVVDLASLSQGKLKVLLTSLLAVKKRKNTDRDASVAAGKRSYLSSDFLALLLVTFGCMEQLVLRFQTQRRLYSLPFTSSSFALSSLSSPNDRTAYDVSLPLSTSLITLHVRHLFPLPALCERTPFGGGGRTVP